MKFIAHRGNYDGPNVETENTPEAIRKALGLGYDVEVDVRLLEGKYWLGHDSPKVKVDLQILADSRVWSHAKDIATFADLSQHSAINTFYQERDAVALTSRGYLWCHSDNVFSSPRSVLNLQRLPQTMRIDEAYAVCSDWLNGSRGVQYLNPIKLIILDVDGVMTDGKKTYDRVGQVVSKVFFDKDWTAIKRFQAAGVSVVALSSDWFNEAVFRSRKIEFYHVKAGSEKKFKLEEIYKDELVLPHQVAVVGDDYYDLMLLESAAHSYCPSDAISDVRKAVGTVLPAQGGQGVVAALWEALRGTLPAAYPLDSPEVNP